MPRSRLGEALLEINALKAKYGLDVANVFHAGDGNLHPLILYDGREAGALDRAEALAGEILTLCVRLGGSITGEHGIGMEKRDYMPAMFSEEEIDIMQALRRAIDPKEIANRGKMFPGGEAPALKQHGMHVLERQGGNFARMIAPALRTDAEIQEFVRDNERVHVIGRGSKTALHRIAPEVACLDLSCSDRHLRVSAERIHHHRRRGRACG